uniref:DYW domain-containing protein n=1 Tax=Kalanchoe fedtschenkoi TaxID=63787 RepID=A0A7N0TZW4_KALFE
MLRAINNVKRAQRAQRCYFASTLTLNRNSEPSDVPSLIKLIDTQVSANGFLSTSSVVSSVCCSIDVYMCNMAIRSYTQMGKHWHSVFLFAQMRKNCIFPNGLTYPAVLKSSVQLCEPVTGRTVHCCVVKTGLVSEVYISTGLVHFYCVCWSAGDGEMMFDEMPVRNAVTWNAMISGLSHRRMFLEACDVFREMMKEGIEPGEVTVVSVLSACAHLGALEQGQWVHEYIVHKGLRMNVFVGAALMDMYAKTGVVSEAEKVFKSLTVKNVYTWNILIWGYAMNGQGEDALRALRRMVFEGYAPDNVTFLGVLSACSHQGLVEEGRSIFKNMQVDFGLRPTVKHYASMVDLLGRGGFLDEAQNLIHNMHLKPDPAIWRALLGACRIHKNAPLTELAVKKLIKIEPNRAENYLLLANLFSSTERWAEVGEVWALMDSRGIKKLPGCSSIEVNNAVYEFVVSGKSEKVQEEIYNLLDEMNMRLRVAGYLVDTDMVSYDVEEEEKERSLVYHSEKLALAFGLLKSPPDSTLRIIKNLRVCRDCHVFFKFVSLVYDRKITFRDRNRFHHFARGHCSCKDFW